MGEMKGRLIKRAMNEYTGRGEGWERERQVN